MCQIKGTQNLHIGELIYVSLKIATSKGQYGHIDFYELM